ncbi:Hypothetical predicted protein [Mytilus galloprovincialis]|uniref:Sushi domain-containing protein n=1 Tax=Mytilus galloprovincialis TaxID=29158 RepID=A0A8B6EW99_MYTGA|nr:Hypothetical predicted protein [Mytilus galloprovincialis]
MACLGKQQAWSKTYIVDSNFNDRVGTSNILLELGSVSAIKCAISCSQTSGCESFFFHRNDLKCDLVTSILNDLTSTIVSANWRYYKGNTPVVTCTNSVTVVGATFTPLLTNATAGDIIPYQCVPGFESITNTGDIKCQGNGTWSTPSDPCQKCGMYSANYETRAGMYFFPPQTLMSWYPTTTGSTTSITATYCKSSCTSRPDFTCVAAYHKPGFCLRVWIRIEENINLYAPYYYNNTDYVEFIRLCV